MKSQVLNRSCKLSSIKPSKKAVMAYMRGLAREYMNTQGRNKATIIANLMAKECKKEGLDQQAILNSVADEMRNVNK